MLLRDTEAEEWETLFMEVEWRRLVEVFMIGKVWDED